MGVDPFSPGLLLFELSLPPYPVAAAVVAAAATVAVVAAATAAAETVAAAANVAAAAETAASAVAAAVVLLLTCRRLSGFLSLVLLLPGDCYRGEEHSNFLFSSHSDCHASLVC